MSDGQRMMGEVPARVCPLACLYYILCVFLCAIPSGLCDDESASTSPHGAVKVYWWHLPPYAVAYDSLKLTYPALELDESQHADSDFTGLFRDTLSMMLTECASDTPVALVSERVSNQLDLHALLSRPVPPPYAAAIYLPVSVRSSSDPVLRTLELQGEESRFLTLSESPGSVLFYLKAAEAVGSDLLVVILQGWPMIVFILLGAAYSGIIIWLLDRLWNSSNFPLPFLRGFWEGFWWAFVTMTTVGYGDTTPKSVQARLYGLVWIMVGITTLSVFTATVTTYMTQETLGSHQLSAKGRKVAIINSTNDFRLAVTQGAMPLVSSDFEDVLHKLETGQATGALTDQFSFAAQQTLLDSEFLLEGILANRVSHGLIVRGNISSVSDCMSDYVISHEHLIFHHLTEWIHPLKIQTTSAAEKEQRLFQQDTINYMWCALAAWVVIFLCFVAWELLYWRPKHRRRTAQKAKLAEKDSGSISTIENDLDRSSGNLECHLAGPSSTTEATVNTNRKPPETKTASRKISKKLQGGFVMNRGPHARFYANRGFVGSSENISASASQTPVRLRGSHRQLQALISRQKAEVRELEEEYTWFTTDWEQRLKGIKIKHKEEQRQYVRKAQSGDHYRSISCSLTNLSTDGSSNNAATTMNISPNHTYPIAPGALPIDII